jgi:hypothetical protein
MRILIKYELGKILKQKSTVMTLIILLIIAIFSNAGALLVFYDLDDGSSIYKFDKLKIDKENALKLANRPLDLELMTEIREAYANIPFDSDIYYEDTIEYKKYAESYDTQARYLRIILSEGLSTNVSPRELAYLDVHVMGNFYNIRHQVTTNSINNTNLNTYSKKKLIALDNSLETPFNINYCEGYRRLFIILYSNSIYFLLGIAICLAPVFSGEYSNNTAPLLLATRYGKNKLPIAKLISGIIFGLITGLTLITISYSEVMILWGNEGFDLPYQLLAPFIPYSLTIFQATLIMIFSIIAATIITTCLTLFLSSKLRTSFWVIIVMGLFLIAPMFYYIPNDNLVLYLSYK